MTGIGDLQTVFGGAAAMQQVEGTGQATSTKSETAAASTAASSVAGAGQDQSVVSTAGDALVQAMGTSDVRMDKVSQLQSAIASGTYSVSSSEVAGKLMESMLGGG